MTRSVVTGHDAQGRAVVLFDGESPHSFVLEKSGRPAAHRDLGDALLSRGQFGQPRRGRPRAAHRARRRRERVPHHRIPARQRAPEDPGPDRFFDAMGAKAADAATRRHPGMHKTDTVDYCVVLSGEIWAVLDEGEVLLRAGDCLVQRGTITPGATGPRRPASSPSC